MARSHRHPDRYVRPPLLAKEPPSRWAAVWRFRLIALLMVAAFALIVLYIARNLINTEQNPTFGASRDATTGATTAVLLIR